MGARTPVKVDVARVPRVELPKGTAYRITEYDGYESIEIRDGVEWQIA